MDGEAAALSKQARLAFSFDVADLVMYTVHPRPRFHMAYLEELILHLFVRLSREDLGPPELANATPDSARILGATATLLDLIADALLDCLHAPATLHSCLVANLSQVRTHKAAVSLASWRLAHCLALTACLFEQGVSQILSLSSRMSVRTIAAFFFARLRQALCWRAGSL